MPSPTSSGIGQLLEAEKKAEEITRRAGEDAERIVSEARRRAEEILAGEGSGPGANHEVARARQEAEAEKARIAREAEVRIAGIRKLATSTRADAVRRLVQTLFGQS